MTRVTKRNRYFSDLDEHSQLTIVEVIRANGRDLVRLAGVVILLLMVECLVIYRFGRADGAEWQPPDFRCIPTVSDYDHAYRIEGAIGALVFWCDLPDGLHTYWVAGTSPGAITPKTQAEALVEMAGKDPADLLKRFVVRESTPSEMELVAKIEISHAPRCYVTGTGATATVLTATAQGTLGPPKLDSAGVSIRVPVGAPVGCQDRLAKETAKRYCKGHTLTDIKGRSVPTETWLACKIERAPSSGWNP